MLSAAVDAYLNTRRALGYKLREPEWILRDFTRFASARGDKFVRTQTALAWAQGRKVSPARKCSLVRTVARFARYAQAEDARHQLPPDGVFGRHSVKRRPPFLFAADDVEALVRGARGTEPEGALQPLVYSTLLGLLACTGLRISEALNLKIGDLTPEGLVVRHGKFGKSRLLPLHPTTGKQLDDYLGRRREEAGACEYFFVSREGRQLHQNTIRGVFHRLVQSLQIARRDACPRPRLHDLRFYFANQALANCPGNHTGISRHVVALTTYLGHSDASYSYWYLEATPQILCGIADRCEVFMKGGSDL
jgi:integrase